MRLDLPAADRNVGADRLVAASRLEQNAEQGEMGKENAVNGETSIGVNGRRFVDGHGRQVLLHGVNMVCKDRWRGYIGPWGEQDLAQLRNWGFNAIRLGVLWDGLEPEPGIFDQEYLRRLRRFIQQADAWGLRVIVDMHQDLYGVSFGDGAPKWATITDGTPYRPTEPWGDAYLTSGAVMQAFDHFWSDDRGPDGLGLTGHYREAWKVLAQTLGCEPNVVGYDVMNEPFPGSSATAGWQQLFVAYGAAWARRNGQTVPALEDLFRQWRQAETKLSMLPLLDDPKTYQSVVESAAPWFQAWEREYLTPFHQGVRDAIRTVDEEKCIFLEPGYFSNMGVPSAIEPVRAENGEADALQAYAPHAYDLLTDTEWVHAATPERVQFIFAQLTRVQDRWQWPMVVGEWGAFGCSSRAQGVALTVQRILERILASDTYWHYLPDLDQYPFFPSLCRGYPMAIGGRLLEYWYDPAAATFQMSWEEDPNGGDDTVIYLPDTGVHAITFLQGAGPFHVERLSQGRAGYVTIAARGSGLRTMIMGQKGNRPGIEGDRRNLS